MFKVFYQFFTFLGTQQELIFSRPLFNNCDCILLFASIWTTSDIVVSSTNFQLSEFWILKLLIMNKNNPDLIYFPVGHLKERHPIQRSSHVIVDTLLTTCYEVSYPTRDIPRDIQTRDLLY